MTFIQAANQHTEVNASRAPGTDQDGRCQELAALINRATHRAREDLVKKSNRLQDLDNLQVRRATPTSLVTISPAFYLKTTLSCFDLSSKKIPHMTPATVRRAIHNISYTYKLIQRHPLRFSVFLNGRCSRCCCPCLLEMGTSIWSEHVQERTLNYSRCVFAIFVSVRLSVL